MKTIALAAVAVTTALFGPASLTDDEHTVASMPPVVISTVPAAGSTDVDPSLKEIKVTFSKEMMNGSWSWSTAWENSSPEITGKPKYSEDGRTCIAQVKLEPGRAYGFWLNSQNFGNFKDKDGRSAVPYLFVFETKGEKAKGEKAEKGKDKGKDKDKDKDKDKEKKKKST